MLYSQIGGPTHSTIEKIHYIESYVVVCYAMHSITIDTTNNTVTETVSQAIE